MFQQPTFDTFLRAHTRISAPAICPEIRLHLADDLVAIWEHQQALHPQRAATPPYWSVAWVGGQALARYTLDHAAHFFGRSVLDIGAGSGLCGIAAAAVGATVDAADTDASTIEVINTNARLNGVELRTLAVDLIGVPSRWDVVLAGDLWYDGHLARRLNTWLFGIAGQGTEVLLGDCGRAFFPRRGITELERYEIPTPESLERSAVTRTSVWRLA